VDGRYRVTVRFEYTTESEAWFLPVIAFANRMDEVMPLADPDALEIEMAKDSVEVIYGVPVSIQKLQLKRDGYKWTFHKNDADEWPSDFHAHDYDRRLKLDAKTGNIYDAVTKSHCGTLNPKTHKALQAELLASKDFSERAKATF
jgi:hypothetical protein